MNLKMYDMEEGKLYLVEFGDNKPGFCFRIKDSIVQLGDGNHIHPEIYQDDLEWDYTETNVTIKDLSLAFGSILEDIEVKK